MLLPKKITSKSRINFVHTSSPLAKADLKDFQRTLRELGKDFSTLRIFDVERTDLDPRYLSASQDERLRKFRRALKEVDWLAPIYGGTGCGDIVRNLTLGDLRNLRRNFPVVSGFSDATFLLNYLHFRLKLLTFHYSNACGLFLHSNHDTFFDVLRGKVKRYDYSGQNYSWLSDAEAPSQPLEGVAIGGNLTTFRDLLDVCDIQPRSWENYILFIEETGEDLEDLHRIIVALDEKGVFRHIKALVIGVMDEKAYASSFAKLDFIFGRQKEKAEHVFEYLLSDVINDRLAEGDPLYILKINNFGHGVRKNTLILPIGGKTVIYPDKTLEFVGPFVA